MPGFCRKTYLFAAVTALLYAAPLYAWKVPPSKPQMLSICPGFKMEAGYHIRFNANEKRLICGDMKARAWAEIPLSQAKYNIRNFLQDRGYYYPLFSVKNGEVVVDPGKQTRLRKIIVEGVPENEVGIKKRRGIIDAEDIFFGHRSLAIFFGHG